MIGDGSPNVNTVKTLMDHYKADAMRRSCSGDTVISCASERGDLDIVKHLVEKTEVKGHRNSFGLGPLHKAAWEGHTDVVKHLLEKGAEVSARDKRGQTPAFTTLSSKDTPTSQNIF